MLQKTQWTLAATALATGMLLCCAARPAHAQFRRHLTPGTTTTTTTGIVTPPSSPGSNVTPPATNTVVTPPANRIVTPPSNPTPPSNNTPAAPLVNRRPISNPLPPTPAPQPPAPVYQPSPQGFSAGPTLLGTYRAQMGQFINRIPPDFNGDGRPDTPASHRIR